VARKDTMTARKRRATVALLAEPTVTLAARRCGVKERTLYRYLADPVFKAELRRRQDQSIQAAVAALSGLSGEAIRTLRDTLTDPEATPSVRLRAAVAVLQERRRLGELDDLRQRVEALEGQWQKQ